MKKNEMGGKTLGRQEMAFQILKYIAIGAMIGSVLVCPNLAQLYTLFDANDSGKKRRVRHNLYILQKRGLIKKGGSEDDYVSTARGIKVAEYDTLEIKQTKWDGKWRLFMFDVPEAQRHTRVALGKKVVQMGMLSYQKSIFITPYACEKELAQVAKFLGVEKYIRLVIASEISAEAFFKKAFALN